MTENDVWMEPEGHARSANLLGALAVGLEDAVRAALAQATGLDVTAVAAVLVVGARPGRSIADLAAALGVTHSGAVRTLDRLVQHGLVERVPGSDARTQGLALTDAGRTAAGHAVAARRSVLGGLLDGLSVDQQVTLVPAMEALLARLPADRRDAWRICRTCEHDVCRGAQCPVGNAVDPADTGDAVRSPSSRRR